MGGPIWSSVFFIRAHGGSLSDDGEWSPPPVSLDLLFRLCDFFMIDQGPVLLPSIHLRPFRRNASFSGRRDCRHNNVKGQSPRLRVIRGLAPLLLTEAVRFVFFSPFLCGGRYSGCVRRIPGPSRSPFIFPPSNDFAFLPVRHPLCLNHNLKFPHDGLPPFSLRVKQVVVLICASVVCFAAGVCRAISGLPWGTQVCPPYECRSSL